MGRVEGSDYIYYAGGSYIELEEFFCSRNVGRYSFTKRGGFSLEVVAGFLGSRKPFTGVTTVCSFRKKDELYKVF